LDTNSDFKTETIQLNNRNLISITAKASFDANSWDSKKLYQPLKQTKEELSLRLVPYFSWGNGNSKEMTVWFSH
jgi:DUF1680 family protein